MEVCGACQVERPTKTVENVSESVILYAVDSTQHNLSDVTRKALEALVRHQALMIAEQSQLIERLRKQVEELQRKSHRQANPFSKNKPKPDPKRPGRKRGIGQFKNRPAPPALPTDIKVQASTPVQCTYCGGGVDLERIDDATVTDIPHMPAPVVTRYKVPVCRCRKCGKNVRGEAPGLANDQAGATAHRMGPRVMAMAHLLHYDLGIPVRKVPQVLQEMAGIRLTASAITQDALRLADGSLRPAYQRLRDSMRGFSVVHSDDTGWRIGGKNAHLMGFVSDGAAVYQIRFHHRSEEVLEIIPADFTGVLVSDRGKSYDATVFAGMKQQKCIGHILRNISLTLETKTGPARVFGLKLKGLLREGLQLWKVCFTEEGKQAVRDLEKRLKWYLRNRILRDNDNQRLLNGIGLQMERSRILTFLFEPGVEPTNNRAERMLRPAVIARKVSQCSKNERGAFATSVFLSILQTLRKSFSPNSHASITDLLLFAISGNPPPAR